MKKFVVISHTHWDREWYMSFPEFRLKLVDLLDRLFLLLEKDPDYIFHIDAQTIVLEDYLELRPYNAGLLKKYITTGNLRVGPWYLQNDFYLTDGESTVRNLQIGIELAEVFGRCDTVGYAPDQFGNITQLPQILADFGIDNFVFGRGFKEFDEEGNVKRLPAEFAWIGADGTKSLAVNLKLWYNNAQHIPEDLKLAHLLLDINERGFEGVNVSPYILLMNGVDHLEPQDDVREIIARLKADGVEIEQSSLEDYINALREYLVDKKLPSYRGALNKGADYDVLKGCWSSRIYLKRENVRTEDLLENKLEPLYSYLERSGFSGAYPAEELRYLWKCLLKNHSHDSICGCSTDVVHRHMEDSFEQIGVMGNVLTERGLKLLAAHSGHPMAEEKNYSVTLFNSTERARREVCTTALNFLISDNVKEFAIYDDGGNSVPYEIVSREKILFDVFSPLNLPGVLDVERTTVRFIADVPPFTARAYAVVAGERGELLAPVSSRGGIENEYYKLTAEGGKLTLTEKQTGRVFENLLRVEDSADKGDAYVFRKSPETPLVFAPIAGKVTVGVFESTLALRFAYDCPAEYDFEKDIRSEEKVEEEIDVLVTLKKGDPVLGVSYKIKNGAKDHRIRLLLAGKGEKLITDSPFDCAERFPFESCKTTDSNTHHNSTFIELSDENGALAVFTEGQHEAERTDGGLALTILRATGVINRDAVTFKPTGGVRWDAPDNECLRTVEGRIGLSYGSRRTGAELFALGKFFRVGLLCHADSFDPKKYSGGRFAVQSAELEKFYYLKDRYAGKTILHAPFFLCENENIAVTCCKRGEKGGTVVRLVNLSDGTVTADCKAYGKIYLTNMSERTEKFCGEGTVSLTFRPKQIVTLRMG